MMNIAIYGAGGFGREVLTLVQDINRAGRKYDIMGFFDDGLPKGTVVNGLSVLGGLEELNAILIRIDERKKTMKKYNIPNDV